MKKHKQRKKRAIPEIPVNSFADVAFLLIIFFIIATTLDRMTGASAELPSGQTGEQQEKTPTVQLHYDKIMFQDNDVSVPELRKKLIEMKLGERDEDDKVVAFEATGDVEYQDYYDVMCTISKAGGIIAIVKEDEGSRK
jgi:biopolymer transport protein ExbD